MKKILKKKDSGEKKYLKNKSEDDEIKDNEESS